MKQSPNPYTIIIAQAHTVFHRGLRRLIAGHTRFQLLGEAGSGPELLELMALHRPHIVVTDLHLPGTNGIETCRTIRHLHPTTGIVTLCSSASGDEVLQAIQAGAAACVPKDKLPAELLPALQAAAEGRLHGNTLIRVALKQLRGHSDTPPCVHFTPRELQIINLICRQYTGREIARTLTLSHRAVTSIRSGLQHKIGVRSGVGIALYALKKGLVRLD